MPSCKQTNNKQTISTKQPNNKQMSASSFQPFPSRTALGLHGKKCPAKSSTRRAKTKRQWVTWFWPSGYHHLLCATAFIVIYAFFDKCAHRLEHHMPSSRIGSLVFSSVVSKTVNRKKGGWKAHLVRGATAELEWLVWFTGACGVKAWKDLTTMVADDAVK